MNAGANWGGKSPLVQPVPGTSASPPVVMSDVDDDGGPASGGGIAMLARFLVLIGSCRCSDMVIPPSFSLDRSGGGGRRVIEGREKVK